MSTISGFCSRKDLNSLIAMSNKEWSMKSDDCCSIMWILKTESFFMEISFEEVPTILIVRIVTYLRKDISSQNM